jgi:hypothetical protein
MKEEHEGYVKYRKRSINWKKQKMDTQERVNVKMLELTIEKL